MTGTLTAKGASTRQRMIDGAAAVIREHGLAVLTLDDVLARTHTSKSQLFHYFPGGKEQLLIAVAQSEADRVLADQQPHLSELDSWTSWTAWRQTVVNRYRQQGPFCPMEALMAQLGRDTPGARAVTTTLLSQWQAQLAIGIRTMQSRGEMTVAVDADRGAAALLTAIQGGVAIFMSTGGLDHLESAIDVLLDHLRA